jgi:hypothetical protein
VVSAALQHTDFDVNEVWYVKITKKKSISYWSTFFHSYLFMGIEKEWNMDFFSHLRGAKLREAFPRRPYSIHVARTNRTIFQIGITATQAVVLVSATLSC